MFADANSGEPRRNGREGAADVVGKTLAVNRVPVTIVGVTPQGFHGSLQVGDSPLVTLPMSARAAIESRTAWKDPGYWWVLLMARLRPGISLEGAQTALDSPLKRTVAEGNPSLQTGELPRLELLPGGRGQIENRG